MENLCVQVTFRGFSLPLSFGCSFVALIYVLVVGKILGKSVRQIKSVSPQPFDNHIFFWLLVFCVASAKLHKKISEENLLNFEKRKNICRVSHLFC